jgi:Helix-turn-helix domain
MDKARSVMPASVDRPLITSINGACELLGGVSRTTLYGLVSSGQLVKVNIGARSFITVESVERYINSLAAGTTA